MLAAAPTALSVLPAGPNEHRLTWNDVATAGGAVTALDLSTVKARLNRTANDPVGGTGAQYIVFADVNATGDITSLDLAAVKGRLNDDLPAAAAVETATLGMPVLSIRRVRPIVRSGLAELLT